MNAALNDILNSFEWVVLLTYIRVQACLLILPGLGERVVPVRVRVALAMAITPLMAELGAEIARPAAPLPMFADVLQEAVVGLATGGLVRLLAFAIDIAASAIAAAASLSQIVGGPNEASPHPIGNFLHLGGYAVAFALGLPIMLMDLMADSFSLWPQGAFPDATGFVAEVGAVIMRSFSLALVLASPFILGGFLYQALSGVINKVMPALPVVFIGVPGQILLALGGLVILAPFLVGIWADALLSFTLPRVP